ncbi:chemotaxis protein CheR [bacterium]|nr:chemotaxis protein CheR [bacterium]
MAESAPKGTGAGKRATEDKPATISSGVASLSEKEYQQIRDLVYTRFGINLTEQKKSLIIGRLNSLLRRGGFTSFSKYLQTVLEDKTGQAMETLVDRISTNHTYFNREADHFSFFRDTVLPEIAGRNKARGVKEFRLWDAGCSSGEEPYTLAMLMLDHFKSDLVSWELGILATDISTTALQKAVNGVYPAEGVEKMPEDIRKRYMKKVGPAQYSVKEGPRKLIMYRKLNLIQDSYPFKRKFHVIFCRNVMIYFDRPTRDALVLRYHRYLEPGGYLFIGHSESLGRTGSPFRYVRPAVYKKEG